CPPAFASVAAHHADQVGPVAGWLCAQSIQLIFALISLLMGGCPLCLSFGVVGVAALLAPLWPKDWRIPDKASSADATGVLAEALHHAASCAALRWRRRAATAACRSSFSVGRLSHHPLTSAPRRLRIPPTKRPAGKPCFVTASSRAGWLPKSFCGPTRSWLQRMASESKRGIFGSLLRGAL